MYFIYFEWRYKSYYSNYEIIIRFRCINWWSYWDSKARNKNQEGGFLGDLLPPLAASLLGSIIFLVVKV